MSELKLKPCPFCGSSDIETIEDSDDIYVSFTIHCKECDATSGRTSKRTVANILWNSRTNRDN